MLGPAFGKQVPVELGGLAFLGQRLERPVQIGAVGQSPASLGFKELRH